MKTKLLAPCALFLATAGISLAQKAAKPPEKPARGGDVLLRSHGGTHDDVRGVSRLTGNVTVRQEGEEFVLHADTLTYDRNLNQAVATGNLKLETADSTIVGASLRANFDTKHIVITGKVVMSSHGKDDGIKAPPTKNPADALAAVARKPSRTTCDNLDFNYDIREALLTGNIRLTQGETVGACKEILFDEENNVAQLKGGVIFTDKDGQTFEADALTNWFDSGKIEFKGPFTLKGRRKTEPDPGKTPAPRQPKTNFGSPPDVPELEKEAAKAR